MRPMIATPCYGGVLCLNYVSSIIKLRAACSAKAVDLSFFFVGNESLITRARNDCVAHFMRSQASHLFWIDADIGFPTEAFFRLLDSGHDVAAAAYPLKGDGAGLAADVSSLTVEKDGFALIQEAPTGFMCIARRALEQMQQAFPELRYQKDGEPRYRLFDTMVDDEGRYLSEDYAFCRRWAGLGGRIHLDTASALSHQGSKLFIGDFSGDCSGDCSGRQKRTTT